MESEKLTSWNIRCLIILMILCGSLVNGAFTVSQDTWISVLLMAVIYLPAMLIFSRICTLFPEDDLFTIIEKLFGKIVGWIVILLMTFYTITVLSLQLRNFTEFTVVIALQNTPPVPIMIILLLTAFYIASCGFSVFGRWCSVIGGILTVNIILTILSSLSIMDFTSIMPVFDHPPQEILSNSFALGSIVVGESVIVMAVLGKREKDNSAYKICLPGLFLGILLFTLVIIRNILILGIDLENSAKFSTYMAVRIIRLGSFFERIESSISFVYILMGITKMVLFLSAGAMGISKLLHVPDYKKLLLPTGIIVLPSSIVVFKNVFEMFDRVWVYCYIAPVFQMLIPLIIWITAEFKTRKARRKTTTA